MSDDTPTERFDPKHGGPTPPDPAGADPTGADPEQYPATRKLPASDRPADETTPLAAPPYTPLYSPTPGDGVIPPEKPPVRPGGTAPRNPPPGADGPKKSRTLMWWLIGIGAALLVTVIVLLLMLFAGSEDEPAVTPIATATETSTPTPSETAEPEPSPTPTTEPAESPTFATFTAPSSVVCEEGEDEAPLTFSWSSTDAVTAYIGVGTQNAALNPTVSDLPPTATYSDLPYDCSVASQVYTVTLEDSEARLTSKTVTITR